MRELLACLLFASASYVILHGEFCAARCEVSPLLHGHLDGPRGAMVLMLDQRVVECHSDHKVLITVKRQWATEATQRLVCRPSPV